MSYKFDKFLCPSCGIWITRIDNAVRHRNVKHVNNINEYTCDPVEKWIRADPSSNNTVNPADFVRRSVDNDDHSCNNMNAQDEFIEECMEPEINQDGIENDDTSDHSDNGNDNDIVPGDDVQPRLCNINSDLAGYSCEPEGFLHDAKQAIKDAIGMALEHMNNADNMTNHTPVLAKDSSKRGYQGSGYEPFPSFAVFALELIRMTCGLSAKDMDMLINLFKHVDFKAEDIPESYSALKQIIRRSLPVVSVSKYSDKETGYNGSIVPLQVMLQRHVLANPRLMRQVIKYPLLIYQPGHDPYYSADAYIKNRVFSSVPSGDRWQSDARCSLKVAMVNIHNVYDGNDTRVNIAQGSYVVYRHNSDAPARRHHNGRHIAVRDCKCLCIHHFSELKEYGSEDDPKTPGEIVIAGWMLDSSITIKYKDANNINIHEFTVGESIEVRDRRLANPELDLILIRPSDVVSVLSSSRKSVIYDDTLTCERCANGRSCPSCEIGVIGWDTKADNVYIADNISHDLIEDAKTDKFDMTFFKDGAQVHSFRQRSADSVILRVVNVPFSAIMSPVLNMAVSVCIPCTGGRKKHENAVAAEYTNLLTDLLSACDGANFMFNGHSGAIRQTRLTLGGFIADYPEACKLTNTISEQCTKCRPVKEYRVMIQADELPLRWLHMQDDERVKKCLRLERVLLKTLQTVNLSARSKREARPDAVAGCKVVLKGVKKEQIRINCLKNPIIEDEDVTHTTDIIDAMTFGIEHARTHNFLQTRIQQVIFEQLLSTLGKALLAQKYNTTYANINHIKYCLRCDLNNQMVTFEGRVKFSSVNIYANVMHAVAIDMFHPNNMDRESFKLHFLPNIRCNPALEDEQCRKDFQLAICNMVMYAVMIARDSNVTAVSEESLKRRRNLCLKIKEPCAMLDQILSGIYAIDADALSPEALARVGGEVEDAENMDGDNDMLSVAESLLSENFRERATSARVAKKHRGEEDQTPVRGKRKKGFLDTPSVHLLFEEYEPLVRRNGSFKYNSEVIGEARQLNVKADVNLSSDRERDMHAEVLKMEEYRLTFFSLLCGTPYTFLNDEDLPKLGISSAEDRCQYFVASAAAGSLIYPGVKLANLGLSHYKGDLGHFRQMIQEAIAKSFFMPKAKALMHPFSAVRNEKCPNQYNAMKKKRALEALLESVGLPIDLHLASTMRLIRIMLQYDKEGGENVDTVLRNEYGTAIGSSVRARGQCYWSIWTEIHGSSGTIRQGDFVIVRQDAEGGGQGVSLAQFIGCLVPCKTTTEAVKGKSCVLIRWFEESKPDVPGYVYNPLNLYKYPEYTLLSLTPNQLTREQLRPVAPVLPAGEWKSLTVDVRKEYNRKIAGYNDLMQKYNQNVLPFIIPADHHSRDLDIIQIGAIERLTHVIPLDASDVQRTVAHMFSCRCVAHNHLASFPTLET